ALLEVLLRHQLVEAARAAVVVVEHELGGGVGDLRHPGLRRLDLRLLETVEDHHAHRPHDEPDDGEHDHDLEQREAQVLAITARTRPSHIHSSHNQSLLFFLLAEVHETKFCMSRMGCRMENTMNTTARAMVTMMAGDSIVVSRCTLPSTSRS